MFDETNQAPFQELPEALVDELLGQSERIGDALFLAFQEVRQQREKYRSQLQSENLIRRDSELGYPDIPTTCGIDGSYGIERLLSTDLVATAAVAIEGLTPPSEMRHWERPHHKPFIQPVKHHEETSNIIRALMMGFELQLAQRAPHDIVFLDGSLTTPLIYLNQALNKFAPLTERVLKEKLQSEISETLTAYKEVLSSQRSDHLFCGVPKYSVKREMGERFGWPESYNDRALLTHLLAPGEFVSPLTMQSPPEPWHLNLQPLPNREALQALREEILGALDRLAVIYYRPHNWIPALRLEVAPAVAQNSHRLGLLFQGIKHQCRTPSILEPYPLYMADRIAKHLSKAIPALRQVTTQRMAERYEGELSDILFDMHGYRTESGR